MPVRVLVQVLITGGIGTGSFFAGGHGVFVVVLDRGSMSLGELVISAVQFTIIASVKSTADPGHGCGQLSSSTLDMI